MFFIINFFKFSRIFLLQALPPFPLFSKNFFRFPSACPRARIICFNIHLLPLYYWVKIFPRWGENFSRGEVKIFRRLRPKWRRIFSTNPKFPFAVRHKPSIFSTIIIYPARFSPSHEAFIKQVRPAHLGSNENDRKTIRTAQKQ